MQIWRSVICESISNGMDVLFEAVCFRKVSFKVKPHAKEG